MVRRRTTFKGFPLPVVSAPRRTTWDDTGVLQLQGTTSKPLQLNGASTYIPDPMTLNSATAPVDRRWAVDRITTTVASGNNSVEWTLAIGVNGVTGTAVLQAYTAAQTPVVSGVRRIVMDLSQPLQLGPSDYIAARWTPVILGNSNDGAGMQTATLQVQVHEQQANDPYAPWNTIAGIR